MKLEAGKMYKTRSGAMVGPLMESGMDYYALQTDAESWTMSGRYIDEIIDSALDLVSECSVLPTEAGAVACPTLSVLSEVQTERARQEKLWGEQNHEPYKWLSILTEEVGEAAQAANDADQNQLKHGEKEYKLQCYREELIQVAAVAVSMVECLDRNWKV